jgi:hypothetical protein
MAENKRDEWRQILQEQRIQRWRDYYLSHRDMERPVQRDVITNMVWNVAYDDTMIDFYAQLLGHAGLCPLKDGFPGQEKLFELCMQVDSTERERLKGKLVDILIKTIV